MWSVCLYFLRITSIFFFFLLWFFMFFLFLESEMQHQWLQEDNLNKDPKLGTRLSQRKIRLKGFFFYPMPLAIAHNTKHCRPFSQNNYRKLQVRKKKSVVFFFYHWLWTMHVFRGISLCHFRHTTLSLKANQRLKTDK